MTKDHWLQSAMTKDVLVADLLLQLKHSSDSDSSRSHRLPATQKAITTILPPRWGHRKNRSKSAAPTTAVTNGFAKEHRGSPTTHLSWSGGGGSTSDGPSDLSSGSRSLKANEIGSISSHHHRNKMRKMEMSNVAEGPQRGFVVPDLNMTPNEEDLMV